MARILAPILLIMMLLAPPALVAQTPTQPAAAPETPPVTGPERSTGFDFIVAFTGVALTLLVVCYPSRRY
ncbi:MAG: hypothetical protein L0Y71_14720 [Gemmataceae bacterium]|nr:hypothetical protein [Gemmataceae bacterium]